MNALIVDDEFHCRNVIEKMSNSYCPEITSCFHADTVPVAQKLLYEQDIDIVFLDIQLQTETGFDLLYSLNEINFQTIFTTAFDNYAIQAFQFGAMHYLLKPFGPNELKEAVERCIQREMKYDRQQLDEARGFYLRTQENSYDIRFEQIMYIQADGSYSTIYNDNDEQIYTSKNLGEYKALLNPSFFRIHNSYIVNMNFVDRLDRRGLHVVLKDGTVLPLSRRRKITFKSNWRKIRSMSL